MTKNIFTHWLEGTATSTPAMSLYQEQANSRATGIKLLRELIATHFIGEKIVRKLGKYKKLANTLKNSLPTNKRTRSGDLGELLATEYVDTETEFKVPIRKLQWKSDREMPMHGNDVIGINTTGNTIRVLKVESKSRAKIGADTIKEAAKGLDAHNGRPNPSSLAFIAKQLYRENNDKLAEIFTRIQIDGKLPDKNIKQLIFALTGNDPAKHLNDAPKPKNHGITRTTAAIRIKDHQEFIETIFTNGK